MIRPHHRALWRVYVAGVIDATEHPVPFTGRYGEPGANQRKCEELNMARRQGFADAKAGRVLRDYEFSRDAVLRRAEVHALNQEH